ncbi:Ferredoxin-6 [compost metagenome]
MGVLIVQSRSGEQRQVQASGTQTLMEIMRDGGIDEILALCGGTCSCATCHVIIDPPFADLLEPLSSDESDLLDGSAHREATSRLACQVRFHDGLDGMRVTIAPED